MIQSDLASKPQITELIIRPSKGWSALHLRDLWIYRELVYFLIWRDVKVRYKQAVLGIAWAIIQPLVSMVVFSVIFGELAKLPTENGIPYPVFSYVALLPWNLFSNALQKASGSLVGNSNLLTKIYFPRLVIPLSSVVSGLVDFGFAFLILFGLLVYYHVPLTFNMLWLPVFLVLALATALAVGLWLSALNVQYRDIQHMVPFLITLWMYASPVVYSSTLIPSGWWRIVYALNPMVGVIQGFRWAILGTQAPDAALFVSSGVVIVLLVLGMYFFRRMERTFADVV